jgi:hypothetical protein
MRVTATGHISLMAGMADIDACGGCTRVRVLWTIICGITAVAFEVMYASIFGPCISSDIAPIVGAKVAIITGVVLVITRVRIGGIITFVGFHRLEQACTRVGIDSWGIGIANGFRLQETEIQRGGESIVTMVIVAATITPHLFRRIARVFFGIAHIDGAGIVIFTIGVQMTAIGNHIGAEATTVTDTTVDVASVIVAAIRVCETATWDLCRFIAFAALLIGDALLCGALIAVVTVVIGFTAIFGIGKFTLSVQSASRFDARRGTLGLFTLIGCEIT